MAFDLTRLSPAERLLWSYGITEPGHIDLDAIANDHGADVQYRLLDGCEARLLARGDQAIISVNIASNEGRQRFSLAHELAHWICDRKTGSFLCAKEDIGPQNAEAKSVEAYANGYASQLILPSYLTEQWSQKKRVNLETAAAMSKDFDSSLTAAAIKLVKGASIPACVACHSQSRLVWFQKSAPFPFDFYIVKALHHETNAFKIAFGATSGMSRPSKESADRWITGRDAYRLSVDSQSIKLPDGTVLTVFTMQP
jgi:Zn-dependent peptidase ImmA (M78 family)